MQIENQTSSASLATSLEDIRNLVDTEIRAYVESHGGRIDILSFEKGIVGIALSGACQGCSALSITLKMGIERSLRRRFRDVDSVQLVA